MKRIATIALSVLFMTGAMEDGNASIFTRNNKLTLDQLQRAFEEGTVGGKSYKNLTHDLYDKLVAARKSFEKTVKTYKLQKDGAVKVFVELLGKIEKALSDIYESDKDSKLIKKANDAKNYYVQNSSAYTLVRARLGGTLQSFEASFRGLRIPKFITSTGDVSLAVKSVFDIIDALKGQMTDEIVQPQQQTTVIAVPTTTAPSSVNPSNNSSDNGNWMFNKTTTETTEAASTQATSIITPVVTSTVQTTTTPAVQTTTTPAVQTTTTPAVAVKNVVSQPAVQTTTTPAVAVKNVVSQPAVQTTTTPAAAVKNVVSQPVVQQQAAPVVNSRTGGRRRG